MGKLEEAEKIFDRLSLINPLIWQVWHNRSVILSVLDHYEEAQKCLNRAININNNVPAAFCIKGVVCTRLGKFVKAAEAFNRAREIDPQYFEEFRRNELELNDIQYYYKKTKEEL